jgi:hypothetical protein
MRLGETHWQFWAREVDASREAEQRAAAARADIAQQEQARWLYRQFAKRLNHRQQRHARRQGRRR